jgi:hypothetical protein
MGFLLLEACDGLEARGEIADMEVDSPQQAIKAENNPARQKWRDRKSMAGSFQQQKADYKAG